MTIIKQEEFSLIIVINFYAHKRTLVLVHVSCHVQFEEQSRFCSHIRFTKKKAKEALGKPYRSRKEEEAKGGMQVVYKKGVY